MAYDPGNAVVDARLRVWKQKEGRCKNERMRGWDNSDETVGSHPCDSIHGRIRVGCSVDITITRKSKIRYHWCKWHRVRYVTPHMTYHVNYQGATRRQWVRIRKIVIRTRGRVRLVRYHIGKTCRSLGRSDLLSTYGRPIGVRTR